MPTNYDNRQDNNNKRSNFLTRFARALARGVNRSIGGLMANLYSIVSFPFVLLLRPSRQELATRINKAGGVLLDGRQQPIRIVRLKRGRAWFWQPVVFIAFKVGEPEGQADHTRILPDTNLHLYVGLKAGTEILGDQVYFFLYSSLRSFERNHRELVAFVQAAYIPIEKRRAENEYFRSFFVRENQNPESDGSAFF
jgi:hypothetical protein